MSGEGTNLAALMAGRGGPSRDSKGTTSQSNSNQYYKSKKNWELKCDYCKNQGHVEDNCFRLHGYPPDWKFKKKGTSVRDLSRDIPRAPLLTDNQHDHIQHMLDGDVLTANVMANMAGMAHTNITKLIGLPWIIDSGATNHMVSTLDVLHDVQTVRPD
ncbi:hypothetical protein KY289_004317 [Solanum tuberosum]|nr:hypothetical protein KY289_004317 [Solanum tuberosum]